MKINVMFKGEVLKARYKLAVVNESIKALSNMCNDIEETLNDTFKEIGVLGSEYNSMEIGIGEIKFDDAVIESIGAVNISIQRVEEKFDEEAFNIIKDETYTRLRDEYPIGIRIQVWSPDITEMNTPDDPFGMNILFSYRLYVRKNPDDVPNDVRKDHTVFKFSDSELVKEVIIQKSETSPRRMKLEPIRGNDLYGYDDVIPAECENDYFNVMEIIEKVWASI